MSVKMLPSRLSEKLRIWKYRVTDRKVGNRWVFVNGDSDWILKGICDEIRRHSGIRGIDVRNGQNAPEADFYFFAHFSRLIQFLERPRPGKRIVMFTHYEDHPRRPLESVLKALHQADKIICLSSPWKSWLAERGIPAEKVTYILGGADPVFFKSHARSQSTVGFCCRYYQRKSPDKLLELVRRMSDKRFILLGRFWQDYPRFAEMKALPNFEYVEASYAQYPSIYSRMDVFVSASRLEGQPVALLEAMMCNIVPVASRVGFAADLIRHEENGYLFDVEDSPAQMEGLVRQAFGLQTDVRKTVERYTWQYFANTLMTFVKD